MVTAATEVVRVGAIVIGSAIHLLFLCLKASLNWVTNVILLRKD